MKKISEHIKSVHEKPHHIRKRIAVAVAAGGAGFVGVIWLSVNLWLGTFAIHGSSFAESTKQEPVIVVNPNDAYQNLAGVGAAAPKNDGPAHIEIIDATPSESAQKKAQQTVLPF